MIAFEIITIAAGAAGIALCGVPYFRPLRTLRELGRHGEAWFDHADDIDLAERPADDAVDEPITFRPLRARLH